MSTRFWHWLPFHAAVSLGLWYGIYRFIVWLQGVIAG